MDKILFFDTEVTIESKYLKDIGAVADDGTVFHSPDRKGFAELASKYRYLCGHNILMHDLKYIGKDLERASKRTGRDFIYIDTLLLSPLLFPAKPYHHLVKDDKLQTGDLNNPVSDSINAKDLLNDEIAAFNNLSGPMQRIFIGLLHERPEFSGFFDYLGVRPTGNPEMSIRTEFAGLICSSADVRSYIRDYPIELAYCLALIRTGDKYSVLAPWVSRNYPFVNTIYNALCNTPCRFGCQYCNAHFDIRVRLREFFGYEGFNSYAGEPLQERAVKAAVSGKSLLAVFPTGGGKSLAFQLPALIAGESAHGLTVVISPLQSVMKDQVDNLSERGISDAATINGSLDPVERMNQISLVENGVASILYIAPESLRSASIERLLMSRNVVRFVIDEAHCFSAWGQDFRVDYLYIGHFIRKLQNAKGLSEPIPVSCFTATAKQKVISDIREHFRVTCGIELELYATAASRENLRYEVIFRDDDEQKYITLREIFLAKACPSIVYVSRTRRTTEIAGRLTADGIPAVPYHGRMDAKDKKANQEAFKAGKVDVVVATTAFGMGIDKDDVGLVVHYNISTSLEDYVQEAGRAGRNKDSNAECYILFNEDDLDKHFQYLNEMKLSINEIKQIWRAIKTLSGRRGRFTRTPLEIARAAGWDDNSNNVETKVKAAISALEQAGYITRGRNVPHVYANGIVAHSMEEAADHIRAMGSLSESDKQLAIEIMNFLISRRSISRAGNDEAESRVDYIADRLGRRTEEVMNVIILLREDGILDDSMDMTVHFDRSFRTNRALGILERAAELERYFIENIDDFGSCTLRSLNTRAINDGIGNSDPGMIKSLLLFWMRQKYIAKTAISDRSSFRIEPEKDFGRLRSDFDKRIALSGFIADYLYNKQTSVQDSSEIPFSVLELARAFNSQNSLMTEMHEVSSVDILGALVYLNAVQAMNFDGGFLVIYNAIQVERLVTDNQRQYRKKDYKDLEEYYSQRRQMIHIVGEYARLMARDYEEAAEFGSDYFAMDYMLFVRKYFKGDRMREINRSITPERYNKLFDSLSPMQRRIIDDDISQHIVVAAGPGSGKTKVLVHKLASLLLLEDVRSEQLLMLTFSRSAATEFKQRLMQLIGDAAYFVEIKTFHSYCFNIIGQIGSIDQSEHVVSKAAQMIRNGEVDAGKITKTVLVLDEAQDMDRDEFALVKALMARNEEMRVIAVGDDDQNIYEFRNSDSEYMRRLISEYEATQYELVDNYRSDRLIVDLANSFAETISVRMKTEPIKADSKDPGTVVISKFRSRNLAVPTLKLIRDTYRGGKCCVMTVTNEDAMLMTGILNKAGYRAKLIQSSDEFNLYNLYELRCFLDMLGDPEDSPVILKETWERAMEEFRTRFAGSTCLPECLKLLETFDEINRDRYYSD